MTYRRNSSQIIADAQECIANLKAIDPNLDLDNSLTVDAFDDKIKLLRRHLLLRPLDYATVLSSS